MVARWQVGWMIAKQQQSIQSSADYGPQRDLVKWQRPHSVTSTVRASNHQMFGGTHDQMRGKPRPSQLAAQQLGGEAA